MRLLGNAPALAAGALIAVPLGQHIEQLAGGLLAPLAERLQLPFLPSPQAALLAAACALLAFGLLLERRGRRVFVLDFAVHRPDPSWRFPRSSIRPLAERNGRIKAEQIDFMEKIAFRTGLGDDTAVVPAIQQSTAGGIEAARFEFASTCFPCVQELLDKTGIKAKQVDFVITNSSLFNPTPSLSALVMNHFKMAGRCRGYSLGGMGCSAGVIALDLAKELLELHPNSCALVISHENITNAFYAGNDPSMLIQNCLFRANGSAALLSNRPADARRAKWLVHHVVRTNMAADDVAFNCVQQTEDAEGVMGVKLTKDIVQVGTKALQRNMTTLGPLVLPLGEQLLFVANAAARALPAPMRRALPARWSRRYVPDFKRAFDFFCIHTGGRGIIDGLEKELQLSRRQVEPSRASLYRFGNTSSTSVWYELAYIESRQGVRRGQVAWQLAFGSGFKFNSAVLVANRAVREPHAAWDGFDAAAMWAELDSLEESARAARAAKAAKAAAAAAAEEGGEPADAAPSAARDTEEERQLQLPAKQEQAKQQQDDGRQDDRQMQADVAMWRASFSGGGGAPDAVRRCVSAGSSGFRSMRSIPSISRRDSLVAVGSGVVPVGDMHHLEADEHVAVQPEEGEGQRRQRDQDGQGEGIGA